MSDDVILAAILLTFLIAFVLAVMGRGVLSLCLTAIGWIAYGVWVIIG